MQRVWESVECIIQVSKSRFMVPGLQGKSREREEELENAW
jgi:hypothetical protein